MVQRQRPLPGTHRPNVVVTKNRTRSMTEAHSIDGIPPSTYSSSVGLLRFKTHGGVVAPHRSAGSLPRLRAPPKWRSPAAARLSADVGGGESQTSLDLLRCLGRL